MHLGDERYLPYLAAGFAALVLFALYALWRDRRDLEALGAHNLLLSPRWAFLRRAAKVLIVLGGLFLAGLGASRLQGKPGPSDLVLSGIDVMVVLDVSKSMLVQDLAPNRLEAAKKAVLSWMDGRVGDRVGLTVFSGEAIVQVPLTLDLQAVSMVLEQADVWAVDRGGSDPGVGIRAALESFGQDGEEGRGRAILLLTDGETTKDASNLEAACREAKEKNVPVLAVGVGTRRGKPIPDGVSFWGETVYKKGSDGRTVVSKLDEKALQGIAETTGGMVVYGEDPKSLDSVGGVLSRLQATVMKDKGAAVRKEWAPALGAGAAALFLLAVML